MTLPLIGIPANVRRFEPFEYHGIAASFMAPIVDYLGFQPIIIPAIAAPHENPALLDVLDGVLLTGAVANIHPAHYGDQPEDEQPLDPQRDAVSLPLVKAVVAAGLPLLGICRGMQEINVAFGGTLVQALHTKEGYLEHRGWVQHAEREARISHTAHSVKTTPSGLLRRLTGADEFMVNSLHEQGIGTLGTGVVAEAFAPDNTIEALTVPAAPAFTLGVLWHPEIHYRTTPASLAIFDAYGAAVRARFLAKRT